MKYKKLALNYFNAFSNKDIESLKEMFSADIQLRDWERAVSGLNDVLQANKNIFESLTTIEVSVLHILESENIVIAEIVIVIDKFMKLLVVDILEFSDDGKIRAIKAFKG